jgi:transcriptional regulator with XRE-family HTH domain
MNASADIVIKLRELRRFAGMSQRDLARKAHVGEKTVSSFETGARIDSMKLSQLQRILRACGVTEGDFFTKDIEELLDVATSSFRADRNVSWYAARVEQLLAAAAASDRISPLEVLGAVRAHIEMQSPLNHLRIAS